MALAEVGRFSGLSHFFAQTLKQDGVKAFASGYVPSAIRIFPYKGIDMMGYLTLKDIFVGPDKTPSILQSLCFGGFASACSQCLTFPLLTVRTKLMAQAPSLGRPIIYSGFIDCFKKVIYGDVKLGMKAEGIRGLYRGHSAIQFKMIPASAIQFATYDFATRLLATYFD